MSLPQELLPGALLRSGCLCSLCGSGSGPVCGSRSVRCAPAACAPAACCLRAVRSEELPSRPVGASA